jgi:ubiquinone/menaquinone biosynthesis C-methylase UbiE
MAFVRPEETIEEFSFWPGMRVADFGCGSGHYTIASARRVGDSGKIFAIDVQKDLLKSLEGAAKINKLKNIETIWANLDLEKGSGLPDGAVDFVIISNILFQADNKPQIAKEAKRILKDNGRVAIIEWSTEGNGEKEKTGPLMEKRVSKDEAKKIFLEHGFETEKEFFPGDNHYGIIFRKNVQT